ncbi:hypothetical protein BGZ65_003034 [Modicella reniformis]|uniref:Uncharacterized protein n=1 Tax=Modicella reniformis TaxID=1440133 RepID=A0A9P6J5Y6_9FUNG|nr:hypothetical protein BGZ65_003034 [Modicella reniformis]
MGLMEKLMRNYEIWKIGKYTKRRAALTPEFEQRDKEYYETNYKDGIYTQNQAGDSGSITRGVSFKRALSRKDTRTIRSSEVYNENPHSQFRVLRVVGIALGGAQAVRPREGEIGEERRWSTPHSPQSVAGFEKDFGGNVGFEMTPVEGQSEIV